MPDDSSLEAGAPAADVPRALVLAGGGLAGIAWETGVLLGICDEAPAAGTKLLDADVLLGTSAGSTVAAQLASGLPLQELFDRQLSTEHGAHEIHPGVSIEAITNLFLSAMTSPGSGKAERLKKIGAVAADTATVGEAMRRRVIEQRLPAHEWPARVMRVTAIDIATGELVVFDADSGVSLVDAVAASCAVPGVWPPVTIGGRRYIDGGVASTVNMSVVRDCGAAVVLVPSGADSPSPWGPGTAAEIETFPGAALPVFADEESLAAFGANPLDPACRAPAARAGRAQGQREAGRIAHFLGT